MVNCSLQISFNSRHSPTFISFSKSNIDPVLTGPLYKNTEQKRTDTNNRKHRISQNHNSAEKVTLARLSYKLSSFYLSLANFLLIIFKYASVYESCHASYFFVITLYLLLLTLYQFRHYQSQCIIINNFI